nr:MAG TPA: TatD family hydrolase [Caudoviricetes sp.]DAS26508.1 MAG TPA: TatD family hydrolase [Caudoviricetes sp.]
MRLLSPSVNPLEYGWFHRLHHWALPQSCGP